MLISIIYYYLFRFNLVCMFFLLLFPFSLLAIYFPWPFIYLSAFTCLGLSFKFTLVPQNFHQPFKTYHRVLVAFWLTISMWRLAIWWSAWKMNTSNPTKHFILAMWNKHSSPPPSPPKKTKTIMNYVVQPNHILQNCLTLALYTH